MFLKSFQDEWQLGGNQGYIIEESLDEKFGFRLHEWDGFDVIVEEGQNFRSIGGYSEELSIEGVKIDLSKNELFQREGIGQVEIDRLVVGFGLVLGC